MEGNEAVLEVFEVGNCVNLIGTKGANGSLPQPPAGNLFEKFVAAMCGEGGLLVSAEDSLSITHACPGVREAAHHETRVRL